MYAGVKPHYIKTLFDDHCNSGYLNIPQGDSKTEIRLSEKANVWLWQPNVLWFMMMLTDEWWNKPDWMIKECVFNKEIYFTDLSTNLDF